MGVGSNQTKPKPKHNNKRCQTIVPKISHRAEISCDDVKMLDVTCEKNDPNEPQAPAHHGERKQIYWGERGETHAHGEYFR